ncbi:hypothetical protein [Nocardia sp. NPDC005825]|uniref:hypothetical protein n=1 Tax=unclassified Nocardia TaxID=2637762 RepID=UPI0033F57247
MQHILASPGSRSVTINALNATDDDVKLTIINQFFTHPDQGTHRTLFHQPVIAEMLGTWFGIELNRTVQTTRRSFAQSGKPRCVQVQTFTFGSTQFFVYMTEEKRRVLSLLENLLADQAVLTTDRTSPPSTLAELTPLWLKAPGKDVGSYYVADPPSMDFDKFFESYATAVCTALGVSLRRISRELGFVLNGDGLRYHRDRLVNQYSYLAGTSADIRERTRVVQDLSVVDWDMQDGTISGTIFAHPLGDRYMFVVEPGEATSLFFSEEVQLPGPSMMPFHCALPVQDAFAASTAGEATGKRFSCLVRGIADAGEVDKLIETSVPADINVRTPSGGGCRFSNGMHIAGTAGSPDSSLHGIQSSTFNDKQGCFVTMASAHANSALLEHLKLSSAAGIFRVTKQGEGFSALRDVLPAIGDLGLFAINRSINTPRSRVSHPIAVHLASVASSVLQLIELHHDEVLHIPASAIDSLYLSPTSAIFHRSAPLDAFHPEAARSSRISTVLDFIIV